MNIVFIAFAILSIIAIVAALTMVTSDVMVHAIFSHVFTLVAIAGIYVLLLAEFLAAVQILIYAAAVTIMLLFGLMLTRIKRGQTKTLDQPQKGLAVLGALPMFGLLTYCILQTKWTTQPQKTVVSTETIASVMFKHYVLPFEVISLILLAALVGAIVLARKEED